MNKEDTLPVRLLRKAVQVESHEVRATLASFSLVFILMAAYYILRPVRDAMASDWSDAEVSFLWNINFLVSAVIVAFYGLVISRVKFQHIVPSVYAFFACTFIAFYAGVDLLGDRTLVDKTFYVWVSVFSLFHISVFWSFMSDTFNKQQAERLFATIAAGASAGAMVGPAIPTLLVSKVGNDSLMLIAAGLLLSVIPLVLYLYRLKSSELGNAELEADLSSAKMSGAWWHGFSTLFKNPYLLGIAAFILLYTFIGSFVYFEQKNLLAEYSRAERTEILGGIDWIVNVLTFGIAFFATGRMVTRLGMPATLALVPVCIVLGLMILAVAPILNVLLALQVARRAGNYAVTRPAREMLFTEVTKEERFKTKPVIDIVVYRGGDAITGNVIAFLTEGVGLGVAAIAAIGALIAVVWAAVAIYLGRLFDRMA
jgi:AAA family ATP:ADP antiporter